MLRPTFAGGLKPFKPWNGNIQLSLDDRGSFLSYLIDGSNQWVDRSMNLLNVVGG